MMKQILLFITLAFITVGCSANEAETSSYDAADYTVSLPNESGEEVEVFTDDRADLYFYFTGTG